MILYDLIPFVLVVAGLSRFTRLLQRQLEGYIKLIISEKTMQAL